MGGLMSGREPIGGPIRQSAEETVHEQTVQGEVTGHDRSG